MLFYIYQLQNSGDYLCAIYNVSLEELADILEDNFNDVFNI